MELGSDSRARLHVGEAVPLTATACLHPLRGGDAQGCGTTEAGKWRSANPQGEPGPGVFKYLLFSPDPTTEV